MASRFPSASLQPNDPLAVADDLRLQRMLEMSRDDDAPAPALASTSPATATPAGSRPAWQNRWRKIPRRTWLLGAGVVALVALAMLIGWALGSGNQAPRAAWQSSPQYEKMYLAMVADKYARTGDALQVQRDLAGARPEEIARILETMQRETTDTTRRQRLVALADTMRPSVSQTSYVPLLFNQPAFVFSLLLSLTPMIVALALVLVPYMRERLRAPAERGAEAQPDELLVTATELEALAEVDANAPVAGAPTPEQAAATAAAAAAEEETKKKEEEEEEEEEQQSDAGGLGDLASLFEEEDTSLAALENFCKGLPEINVDVLLANAKEAARALKNAVASRA